MSSNTDSAKKRRVDERGGVGASGENNMDGSVQEELRTISTHMTNMTEQSRMQTQNMANMMQMMQSMQGEITRLTEKCDRMEKSIDAMKESQNNMQVTQTTASENMKPRFDYVENKLNYHEILLKNQQWKYSAPRPSPGYWNGVDENGDAAAETFLEQIKQCTEQMRYGTGDGNIIIDVVLPYNEEFLPHWEEFANALEQYQYCLKCPPKDTDNESTLRLSYMDLPDTVMKLLSKALEPTLFNRFVLGNNNFGRKGIEFAFKYLMSNHTLKDFGLLGNPFEMNDIKQLCQVVKEHTSIEKLALVGCRGEGVDGYEMLQMIMSAGKYKLKLVDLCENGISTGGDTFISDFLASNSVLIVLELSGNELDDNDARSIAGALKHNTNLRFLDVRNNSKITEAGWAALRKVEFDDTSLNSVADSNHTCYIKYPSEDDEVPQGLDTSEINGSGLGSAWFDAKNVRRKKVYSVLSSRNRECSNVGHFDDVPVEFLPEMIRTFQQYSEYHTGDSNISQGIHDVNPLSLVFEVCRYWDKSLALYELLSS